MNEMVKYHNDLNTASLRTWTETEMNILFSVIAKVKDKSTTELIFTFDELKKLSRYGATSKNVSKLEFVDLLFKILDKLGDLKYRERSANGLSGEVIILFRRFKINEDETLHVKVDEDFERIFNNLGIHFTTFELLEFVNISSTYAKTTYRLLKQFRTQGWWQVSLEDFRSLLSIPDSYKSGNIDQQILKPILTQLGGSDENAIFKNLKVEKIKKAGRGRGGILTGYKFTFDKEKTTEWIENKYTEPTTKPKPTKSKVKKENLPEWAENQTPAPPQKTYTETDFASVNDRIASLKSSGKEA